MTRLLALLALTAGGGPGAADHRAVFRQFALQVASLAVSGGRAVSRRSP